MRIVIWVLAVVCVVSPVLAGSVAASAEERVNRVEVRRQLADILRAPEYNRKYGSATKETGFVHEIMDRVGGAIERFVEWIGEALSLKDRRAGGVASFVFACLVVLGFVVLIGLIVRRLAGAGFGVRVDRAEDGLGSVFGLPSARPLIVEAARLADAGDYRGAFRCAYMASISHLDDIKAVRFERSRTNWEYLHELRQGGFDDPYDALRQVTLAFDRKFYGRESCGRQDYLNALAAYERIVGEAE